MIVFNFYNDEVTTFAAIYYVNVFKIVNITNNTNSIYDSRCRAITITRKS